MENQTTSNVTVTPPKKRINTKWILLLDLCLLILMICGGILLWQNEFANRNGAEKNNETVSENENNDVVENDDQDPDPEQDDDESDDIDTPDFTIIEYDENTNTYTNNVLDFSINVPKKMYHSYGALCEMVDGSYRPKGGLVPVAVFEDGDEVFISSEYFYVLGGETTVNGVTNFSSCDRVENSLANLRNTEYFEQQSWKMVFYVITSDAELDNMIKALHGQGCSLGQQSLSTQAGVYDVGINGDGLPMETTQCSINYSLVLKYYPEKDIAVNWNLGQAVTFFTSENPSSAFDQDMVESFRFE